ncbi:MAG: hypothetical protein ACTSRI_16015 [Promethearchaeota archaeon]
MKDAEKVKIDDFIMLWGFIFFIMGLLGVLQIGFYEGLSDFYGPAFILLILGILIIVYLIINDKLRSK